MPKKPLVNLEDCTHIVHIALDGDGEDVYVIKCWSLHGALDSIIKFYGMTAVRNDLITITDLSN